MAGCGQSAAAVAAAAGEDEHAATARIAAEQVPGEQRQVSAGVLHHLLERDRELDHQAVDFTHLLDRQPGNRVGSDRREGQVGAGVSARAALFRRPVALELHAEPVGDAVDVVVVGDDLVRVDDRAVVEAVRAQPLEVCLEDLGGSER